MDTLIQIMKLNDLNTLVIKQKGEEKYFITTDNSIIISINNLSYLLKYLIVSGMVSHKVLEGILEEIHDSSV